MGDRIKRALFILMRLYHNQAGNTLAMVAAGLLPLLGLIGGGVDMSRIYLTKTRMQQACDAGALAGRRMMGTGAWAANSNAANTAAVNMYNANFQANSYGSTSTAPSFSESGGTVTGTASATLPMTIMKVFGQGSKLISVTCSSKMEIPNTDVMFVLDTTGSMADCADGTRCYSNNSSKIAGIKKAVKCFYEALAKIDTSADCGSTPTGSNNPGVQLRFGFMPYSTNVNVGKLLPVSYIADSWKYQSRRGVFYQPGAPIPGSSYDESATKNSTSSCNSWATSDTATGFPATSQTPDSFTVTTNDYTKLGYDKNTDICTRRVDQSSVVYIKNDNGSYFHTWIYQQRDFNVSSVKSSPYQMTERIGSDGSSRTITWDGCIEERETKRQTSYDPIDGAGGAVAAGAKDLDIDSAPTSDPATQWKPALRDLIFARQVSSGWNQLNSASVITDADYYNNVAYYCPVEAKKLQVWTGATAFEGYVDSLAASGNTYHDIGLLWGARFASPTGIFASENAFTPTGGQIQRNIIFMTDGDTNTNYTDYNAYGFPALDRRQTSDTTPSANTDISASTDAQVDARYAALCTAVKNRGFTLWVISYGTDVASATRTRLQNCASSGRFFNATDTSTLISNFQQIASTISQLRLTQ
jgi:Flp pilus assembly protein TadG